MTGVQCLYMDSLCSHHAEIQYLYLIYTVYNVIILPFHSCKKKREPFTALFHIDFLIHLSYSTVWQPMSLNFFPKMGQSLVLHQMPSQLLSFDHILLQIPMQFIILLCISFPSKSSLLHHDKWYSSSLSIPCCPAFLISL